MSSLDPNTVQYHMVDTVKFLIWAMVILAAIYVLGTYLYDRWLMKKAWKARQRQAVKRLKNFLAKRKLERFKRGPLPI